MENKNEEIKKNVIRAATIMRAIDLMIIDETAKEDLEVSFYMAKELIDKARDLVYDI